MIVAVTGGTGFVGTAVVARLLEAGHEVRVLSRSVPDRLSNGLIHFPGNVVTGDGLDNLVHGVGVVINLVGIIREEGANTFEGVHHGGTVNIMLASSKAGVRRYLHMSALGTREGAVSAYHRSKWKGEEAVRASVLDWTIFRPSIIFGPSDSFINMLVNTMRKTPIMPVMGGGQNLMQPVSVGDVAASFTTAVESEDYSGKTYELGGPDIFTLKQILEIVAQIIEIKRQYINIPMWVPKFATRLAEVLGIKLPVTSDQLIMLEEDNIRTGGDPVEELGVEWTGFEEGIRSYLSPNRE